MSDQEYDVIADFAAQSTGTVGVSDDAGLDQAVPDSLADDIDAYSVHAERRDAHLVDGADDADADDAEPEQEATPQPGAAKTVPLGALQEERNLRKQLQDRQRELETELQQYRNTMAQLAAQQQQAAQQQAIPDFAEDPEGHVKATLAQQQQQLQAVVQQQELQRFGQELRQQATAIAPSVTASEDAMREEVGGEAYDQAYRFVHQHFQAELAQRYPGAHPQMLVQLEQVTGLAFVQQCAQQGIDPARHIYERARALGYQPAGQRVPGHQRRAAPTSLSTVPAAGRAPDQRGKLTAADISRMPQEDFDKLFESMRDTQRPQF